MSSWLTINSHNINELTNTNAYFHKDHAFEHQQATYNQTHYKTNRAHPSISHPVDTKRQEDTDDHRCF